MVSNEKDYTLDEPLTAILNDVFNAERTLDIPRDNLRHPFATMPFAAEVLFTLFAESCSIAQFSALESVFHEEGAMVQAWVELAHRVRQSRFWDDTSRHCALPQGCGCAKRFPVGKGRSLNYLTPPYGLS
jgi:hypothetical protein